MGSAGAADPFVKQNEATQQVKDLKPLLVGINKLKLERRKQPKRKAEKAIQQHQESTYMDCQPGVEKVVAWCGAVRCSMCCAVLYCTVLAAAQCT